MKKFLSLALCLLLFASMTFTTSAETATEEENKHFIAGDYICEIVNNKEIFINYYIGTKPKVTVPASIGGLPVKTIGKWAFFGANTKEVIISEGITTIEEEAFYNCQSLETAVLPSTMKATGEAVFRFCQNLKSVTFSGTDSTSQTNNDLLGKYLFYACNSLEDVNIPDNVTRIPRGAFAYCQNLDTVELPNETEQINNNAFYNSGLTSITLPETLYFIGSKAFGDCTSLSEVDNQSEVCDIVSDTAFSGSTTTNPYEETETITIYFANVHEYEWTHPSVSFYTPGSSVRDIYMDYYETNNFGQDIYKAEIPADTTSMYFNGDLPPKYLPFPDIGGSISSDYCKVPIENNKTYYVLPNTLDVYSYTYSPDIYLFNPDYITIYFANVYKEPWSNIYVSYYIGNTWGDSKMYYFETNNFGQDIYKALIPVDAYSICFDGRLPDNTEIITASTYDVANNNAYYVLSDGLTVSSYTYSPDINPLEPDTEEEETITIRLDNNYHWDEVNVYYRSDSVEKFQAMTYVYTNDYGNEVYEVTIPASTNYVVFTSNSGASIGNSGECSVELLTPEDKTIYYLIETEDSSVFELGSAKYESDAKVYIKGVASVGASSDDTGTIADDKYLIDAPFSVVADREKENTATVGAQVEEGKADCVRNSGDANMDEKLNIRDASDIQKYVAGIIPITDPEFNYKNADVDADGKVSVKDATLIQKHIAGAIYIPNAAPLG